MAAVSLNWRQNGNHLYKMVNEEMSVSIQVDRLDECLGHYYKARNFAATPEETASAYKNVAMASWKLAKALYKKKVKEDTIQVYFQESLKHFRLANKEGESKGKVWMENLLTSAILCWEDLMYILDTIQYIARIRYLEKYIPLIMNDDVRGEAYLELAKNYFHAGINELHKREYKRSIGYLKDCHFPMYEARRFGRKSEYIIKETDLLEHDLYVQMSVTESIKARVTGDSLLIQVVSDDDVLNIDMIWDIIDWYRQAILLTRDQDLEHEAIAHSKLGEVYDKVLKLRQKAKENFTRCLELVNLMVPRTFHSKEWHKTASSALKRYQHETLMVEQRLKTEEKQKVLPDIKDDLDTLDKKFKDATKIEFLKFIYKKYVPKNPMFKGQKVPKDPEISEWKKLYCKAIVHYHPDKVDVEKHGLKWKVLSEEITKLLTQHYEHMK